MQMSLDTTEEIVAHELDKQRRKLRDITTTLDVQHQLLRLIIQVKFDIQFCRKILWQSAPNNYQGFY